MCPALPRIFKAFCQMPVNEAFGREGDFAVLDGRFQKIPDLDMHLFADMLRDDNLKLVFDGDDIHEIPAISLTVEQYNFTEPQSTCFPTRLIAHPGLALFVCDNVQDSIHNAPAPAHSFRQISRRSTADRILDVML